MAQHFTLPPLSISRADRTGPAAIALGLLMLLAALRWPSAPVVTAVAVVALGATVTTIARFHKAPALCGVIAIHLFVYTSLYFLVIGAVCHAATAVPWGGLTSLQELDVGVSAGVMIIVVRLGLKVLTGGGDAPAR